MCKVEIRRYKGGEVKRHRGGEVRRYKGREVTNVLIFRSVLILQHC